MGNSITISISHVRKLRPRRAAQQESSSGCWGGFKVETAPVSLPCVVQQFTQGCTWASSCLISPQEEVQLPTLLNSVSKPLSQGCSCLIMVSRGWAPEESKSKTTEAVAPPCLLLHYLHQPHYGINLDAHQHIQE